MFTRRPFLLWVGRLSRDYTNTRCCARYCTCVVANGSMEGLQCGNRAVRQYSRIAGRKNGSSGGKDKKQYGMALLGFRTRAVLDPPGRQSALPYPNSLTIKSNTLSANCGKWKSVAYVYKPSAQQISDCPRGGESRWGLTCGSCLDLVNAASMAI